MLTRLRRKARTFLGLPLFVQLWLLPLWLILGASKALIVATSFRRLAPRLGQLSGAAPWVPLLDARQESRALLIGRAVRLAARYTPWDSNCFPQAVAARVLLGLYGIPYALYFGVSLDPRPDGMQAHAWVAAGRVRGHRRYRFRPLLGGRLFRRPGIGPGMKSLRAFLRLVRAAPGEPRSPACSP